MKTASSYAYVIERADDGSYWGYLPDLPGCVATGDSAEQVERDLPDAVKLYLDYYAIRDQTPPRPEAKVGTLTAA